jgi:hypothetical protein
MLLKEQAPRDDIGEPTVKMILKRMTEKVAEWHELNAQLSLQAHRQCSSTK